MVVTGNFPGECLLVQASSWKPWGFLVGHTISVSLISLFRDRSSGQLKRASCFSLARRKSLVLSGKQSPSSWGSLVVVELFNALAGHRVHPQQRRGWGTRAEGGMERIGDHSSIVGQDGACDSVHLTQGPICDSVL